MAGDTRETLANEPETLGESKRRINNTETTNKESIVEGEEYTPLPQGVN